jgi:hypothetical protein
MHTPDDQEYPFTLTNSAGRLVEVGLFRSEVTEYQGLMFRERMRNISQKLVKNGLRFVICLDLRGLKVMAPQTASLMIRTLRPDKSHLSRSALIISEAAMGLQIDKVMGAEPNEMRKRFYEVRPLLQWLGEDLNGNQYAIACLLAGIDLVQWPHNRSLWESHETCLSRPTSRLEDG